MNACLLQITFRHLIFFLLVLCILLPLQVGAAEGNKYLNMSLEDLLNVEVSSVSRKQELLRNAGAAVFVISAEDIRRSGATSIPEALRMAPGINVARINANSWAFTARGFKRRFANKLRVLIDGRSVYTPSYSGVYWDDQDTNMADIERIEVIRGPGATLWGSNAVNGIINIISKHAQDTQGGQVVAGGGSKQLALTSLRYGAAINENTFGRAYAKFKKTNDFKDTLNGSNAGDSWSSMRSGFRVDTEPDNANKLTLQGDVFRNNENQIVRLWQATAPYMVSAPDAFTASGWNTLGRLEHSLGGGDSASLQVYYDHNKRDEIYLGQQHDTLDIDLQHNFGFGDWQEMVWGLGFRDMREVMRNTFTMTVPGINSRNRLFSSFIQDDIKLGSDALHLVLGSKFEHNEFTGWEVQPNARLTWSVEETQTLWFAVSRAARTPSRYELYGTPVARVQPPAPPLLPVPLVIIANGNAKMESEKLTAYEMGYRIQPMDQIKIDVAAFYNVYDKLRTYEPAGGGTSFLAGNMMQGRSYGVELAASWQAMDWWQLHLAYSNLNVKLNQIPGGSSADWIRAGEGSSPKHQMSLRSNMTFASAFELDVWGRYTSRLKHPSPDPVVTSIQSVQAYAEMDVRLGWQVSRDMEVSLVGQNLLHARHLEFIEESFIRPTSVERSVYGMVKLGF